MLDVLLPAVPQGPLLGQVDFEPRHGFADANVVAWVRENLPDLRIDWHLLLGAAKVHWSTGSHASANRIMDMAFRDLTIADTDRMGELLRVIVESCLDLTVLRYVLSHPSVDRDMVRGLLALTWMDGFSWKTAVLLEFLTDGLRDERELRS
ncbi:hypothetical protein GGF32_005896 [Allomyces javanicus]|nr:hypothetical protein GGF32_005896 [Allomyces javanicus]